jgi:hypothetical protein
MKHISKLTLADIKAMKPRPDVWAFVKACGGDIQKFWDTCPSGDWLLWLLRKTGKLPELEARAVTLAYARKVLPIFEKRVPFDDGPRRCLKAVENFIKNPTVVNQRAMSNAAFEVHATYTAYAAASAAYHSAYNTHPHEGSDYAIHFATAAADVIAITGNNSFDSTISLDARKKFEQWGANKVRSIIKLPAQKSKRPKARKKP